MNRLVPPKYKQAEDVVLILPKLIELQNGVSLYWMKEVKDDSVRLDIEWAAGSKYQEKKLVANFTNKLLLSGNDEVSSKEIAEEIDFYGGYTQMQIDKDHGGLSIFGLVENIDAIFAAFNKGFLNTDFLLKEIQKEVSISLNKFKVEAQKVKTICQKEFTKNLYGVNTRYGQVAEETDYEKLERVDLLDFFRLRYTLAPTLFLTGNVPQSFIDTLHKWSGNFRKPIKEQFNQSFVQHKGLIELPKNDALQSAVRIGRLMFKKLNPDYYKFQLLNTILGGYFGSRLMSNIREDKGYTYGIGSGMAVLEDAGYFYITTEVGKDVRYKAIEEIFNELDRLKNELVSDDELTKVKNYMLGEFLRQADGPMALMDMFKNLHYNKLPADYYTNFIAAIHAATPEELQALAKKYFDRSEMLIVAAG